MKMFFSVCLLFVFLSCSAKCPSRLSGTWVGNYTDHGPFDRTILIALKIVTHGNRLSGKTLILPQQKAGLAQMSLSGTCSKGNIIFTLRQDKTDETPNPSKIFFINPNEIQMTLHWQTAMIGGQGNALLERHP